jgi:acyl-CoA synthetase (AMP-forming)/AMP-acid ligase II
MIDVNETSTVADAFARTVQAYHDRPFLVVPSRPGRDYYPQGYQITYGDAARQVAALVDRYRSAGVGNRHRIAVLLENRPEHLLHKLALNIVGASSVPINPDYRSSEIAYLVQHANVDAAIVLQSRASQFRSGCIESGRDVPTVTLENFETGAPTPERRPSSDRVTGHTEASLQYTSGTTGRPKGCIMSQGYELVCGAWYATRGGLAEVRDGEDRLYTALPLYHCNSLIYSYYRILLTGGCQIQSDRFHPQDWWHEVVETRATIMHYLGVLIPMLLAQPETANDQSHSVRFAVGAGVEPQLQSVFEERFGIPLIEQWGMTELCRCTGMYYSPRKVGTRACGRPVAELEVRVVDQNDRDVPVGTSGELIVRHSAETPRKNFFSGYLNDEAATESAWRGGWFHSGDIVTQDDDLTLHFVERKKNIIRRSGENIAPAEIEALILGHPEVSQVAVLAMPDDVREEEVLACIVLANGPSTLERAREIFDYCHARAAYYKAPGWIYFTDRIPTTGTLKVQKHQIFAAGVDPRQAPGMFDLRPMKRRSGTSKNLAK